MTVLKIFHSVHSKRLKEVVVEVVVAKSAAPSTSNANQKPTANGKG